MCFLSRKKVQTEKVCNSPGAQNQSHRDWSMLSNADVKCVACMCAYDVRAIFFKFAICSLFFSYRKKKHIRINKNSHILPSRYYLFLCRKKVCTAVWYWKINSRERAIKMSELKRKIVWSMWCLWSERIENRKPHGRFTKFMKNCIAPFTEHTCSSTYSNTKS